MLLASQLYEFKIVYYLLEKDASINVRNRWNSDLGYFLELSAKVMDRSGESWKFRGKVLNLWNKK